MLTGAFTLAVVLSIMNETARLHDELAAFSVILLNGTGGGHCPQVPAHILPGEKKR